MELVCPKCGESVGVLRTLQPLNVTVSCPFDGTTFGVAISELHGTEPLPDAPAAPTPAEH